MAYFDEAFGDPLGGSGMSMGDALGATLGPYADWWKRGGVSQYLPQQFQPDPGPGLPRYPAPPSVGDVAMSFAPGDMGAVAGTLGPRVLSRLLTEHAAQPNALPLAGARDVVTPPPNVSTAKDVDETTARYANYGLTGAPAKDWYGESGTSVLSHAGDDPRMADAYAAALARTSPTTDVASNSTFATTAHNQAMVGDPIRAGRYPNNMGKDIEGYYYRGEPVTGEKIGPFMSATASTWNPTLGHELVNDMWNMRALGYPGENGAPYSGTPTTGEHNFARLIAQRSLPTLQQQTGVPWSPKQAQAAVWTAIKSQTEGTPIPQAGFNFADAMRRNYAQLSWESAPGLTSSNLAEYHNAPPEVQQEFHSAIRNALVDPQGRDIISRHLGLLTGPTFDAPGVYLGKTTPGSQAQVAVGTAPGGALNGIDPASRALLNTSEATRALLLRQDAGAYHKPFYVNKLNLADANTADVRLGRPLSLDEAKAVTQAMAKETGSNFFNPIATPNGFRFINVPDVTGIDNKAFQQLATKVAGHDMLPDAQIARVKSDLGFQTNDWAKDPNGQGYRSWIAATQRPNLQRASQELLATLGPKVAAVEEDFARRYGWTPNRATRIWEAPGLRKAYEGVETPSPPQPWATRPNLLLPKYDGGSLAPHGAHAAD